VDEVTIGPTAARLPAMSVEILHREMYSEAEAARLLRMSQSTLHYWLEGGVRRGKRYRPVIREAATDTRAVTWAEFIEAGLLRQYRTKHGVPMAELRDVIDTLRDELGVPYPLADRRPFVGVGRRLIVDAQAEAKLSPEYSLVAVSQGQLVLTSPSQAFVDRVTWADDLAVAWRPHDDHDSRVVMDPVRRFGRPSVQGVSTEVIWEHEEAGEAVDDIAIDFGLHARDVRWALAYENATRAA
jgi:uncharacterized protein (DUF433 family)